MDKFDQKWKFGHYLLIAMKMESRVKLHSKKEFSKTTEVHGDCFKMIKKKENKTKINI